MRQEADSPQAFTNIYLTGHVPDLRKPRLAPCFELAYISQPPMPKPMPRTNPDAVIEIRNLMSASELEQVLELEQRVWALADIDRTSLTLAIALQAAGSIWVGAFDGKQLIGFALAFPSLEQGRSGFHSHMLAVDPAYRELGIGYRLKLAERERALALKVQEMTWTFDPLRSTNAHLNFARLGVSSESYRIDFYGPQTSSPLHRNSTDRLWVSWHMLDRRVEERLQGKNPREEVLDALRHIEPLVRFNGDGQPVMTDFPQALSRRRVAIEIPGDIGRIEREDLDLAREWRLATRKAFTAALDAGFTVREFCRAIRGQQGPGVYLLERGD
jgi:predicted GNAT superfamily acetyltransferase